MIIVVKKCKYCKISSAAPTTSEWSTLLLATNMSYIKDLMVSICISYHFSKVAWHRELKLIHMENKDQPILYNQSRGCWWPRPSRSHDIHSHDIDKVYLEWSRSHEVMVEKHMQDFGNHFLMSSVWIKEHKVRMLLMCNNWPTST